MIINNNLIVAIYATHSETEATIRKLQHAGFEMRNLSIIGCDPKQEAPLVVYLAECEHLKCRASQGAFWSWIWSTLDGSAVFMAPGFGQLFVAGPLVGRIVSVLDGTVATGGVSVVGSGLQSLGIPQHTIVQYEKILKSGGTIVVAQGTAGEITVARNIFVRTHPETLEDHQRTCACSVGA